MTFQDLVVMVAQLLQQAGMEGGQPMGRGQGGPASSNSKDLFNQAEGAGPNMPPPGNDKYASRDLL